MPKVLILGPEDGPQGDFVGVLSQVKVRSSARSTDGVVPMHFGRIRLDGDLDLQVYGADRVQVEVVVEAIHSGLLGAIVLVAAHDLVNPAEVQETAGHLEASGIPIHVGLLSSDVDEGAVNNKLGLEANIIDMTTVTKESTKAALLLVLQGALELTPES